MIVFKVINLSFLKGYKKNVDFIRLRSLRYRQTPNNLKRVKAHAIDVSISLLLLWLINILANFDKQEYKLTLLYVCLIPFVYAIGGFMYDLRQQI